MKLATTAPALDFAALKAAESAHDVNYMDGKLARRRAHFAFLSQRYQDMLTLDDEGFTVSITLKSDTKTVTLDATESEKAFDMSDIYQLLGGQLARLQAEILGLLESKEKGECKLYGPWEPFETPMLRQILALCLPQPTAQPLPTPTTPATPAAKAAKAA